MIMKRLMLMVLIMTSLGLLSPVSASAATVRTQVEMAQTETPASDSDDGDDAEETDGEEGEDADDVAYAVIAFGLIVIVAILIFVYVAQDRFYDLAHSSLRRLGKVPDFKDVDSLLRSVAQPPSGLKIEGPTAIAVGQTAEYSATKAGEVVEATWSAGDTALADLNPSVPTKKVRVTAKKAGTLTIQASAGENQGREQVFLVTVEGGSMGSLPFVGKGFGSLVVAVFVAALVAVLGLLKVIGSEAVATLYGALLGYVFAKAAEASSSTGGTGTSTGENAAPAGD